MKATEGHLIRIKRDFISKGLEPMPTWRAVLLSCGMAIFGVGIGGLAAVNAKGMNISELVAMVVIGLIVFILGL